MHLLNVGSMEVIPKLLTRFEGNRLVGLILSPVDLAVFQGLDIDLADRRLLALQGILGVLAPVVGRSADDAMRERCFAGCGSLRRTACTGWRGTRRCPGYAPPSQFRCRDRQALFFGPVAVYRYFVVEVSVGGLVAQVGAGRRR